MSLPPPACRASPPRRAVVVGATSRLGPRDGRSRVPVPVFAALGAQLRGRRLSPHVFLDPHGAVVRADPVAASLCVGVAVIR